MVFLNRICNNKKWRLAKDYNIRFFTHDESEINWLPATLWKNRRFNQKFYLEPFSVNPGFHHGNFPWVDDVVEPKFSRFWEPGFWVIIDRKM